VLRVVSHHMTSFNAWAASKDGTAVASEYLHELTTEGGIEAQEKTMQAMLAVAVAGEAKMASLNTKLDGPFAREVQKYYPGEDFHGGKVDDICAIVAVVVRESR